MEFTYELAFEMNRTDTLEPVRYYENPVLAFKVVVFKKPLAAVPASY